ncbi:MAG: helix-turn-helix domain-containing protein [Silicimonas sp.]|jgi:DNA-binding transcriptional ArsR family regulator|nr:helix-turn-helix domain-containing protein [Silicimonas sp.]
MEMIHDSSLRLEEVASTFAALGSEQRLHVLRTLVRAGPEGLAIGELGARSGVMGSTLTHHMKLLAAAGLVDQVRAGRRIICIAAAFKRMQAVSEFLLRECCADARSGERHDHG